MTDVGMNPFPEQIDEEAFAAALAEGDAAQASLAPILRHLLANDGNTLLNEEIVARFRGMLSDVVRRLLTSQAHAAETENPEAYVEQRQDMLAQLLLANADLVRHIHALAMESQACERLQQDNSLEPVLSPLLQALIGSPDPETASTAMAALAAQARFVQSQKRMELPIGELPGDLFHVALVALRNCAVADDAEAAEQAAETLRTHFDERGSRIGLLSRLVTGMGAGAVAALNVEHSGLAIFLTTLAIAANEPRELAVTSLSGNQIARLVLSLRTAGLSDRALLEQLMILNPNAVPPEGIEHVNAERAANLLSAAVGS